MGRPSKRDAAKHKRRVQAAVDDSKPALKRVLHEMQELAKSEGEFTISISPQVYGERVRAARKHRNWSLQDLAPRVGLTSTSLWKLETGKNKSINEDVLVLLVAHLGCQLQYLAIDDVDSQVKINTFYDYRIGYMNEWPGSPEQAEFAAALAELSKFDMELVKGLKIIIKNRDEDELHTLKWCVNGILCKTSKKDS